MHLVHGLVPVILLLLVLLDCLILRLIRDGLSCENLLDPLFSGRIPRLDIDNLLFINLNSTTLILLLIWLLLFLDLMFLIATAFSGFSLFEIFSGISPNMGK